MGDNKRKIERINCPLCGSLNSSIYGAFDSGLKIVSCSSCNTVYTSPRLTAEERNRIYQSGYFNGNSVVNMDVDYTRDSTIFINDAQQRCALVKRYLEKEEATILEIGSAAGFFINELRINGFDPLGIEISEEMCEYARKTFDVKCHCGTLADAHIDDDSVDAVAMWHVLEHTPDPVDELKRINTKLKDGGLIFITVPNINSGNSRKKKLLWPHLQPEVHLIHFSPETLISALRKSGFEPVKSIKTGGTGLLGQSSMMPGALRGFLIRNIKRFSILRKGLKYFLIKMLHSDDFITVIGRKG